MPGKDEHRRALPHTHSQNFKKNRMEQNKKEGKGTKQKKQNGTKEKSRMEQNRKEGKGGERRWKDKKWV